MPALGFNEKIANEAHVALFHSIERLLRTICKRPELAVVMGVRESDGTFKMVTSMNFGSSSDWEFDYYVIARGKAALTAEHNMPSREIQLMHPELLEMGAAGEKGDIKYWGSAILGNLVVACSGVESYFDEAFSYMIVYLWRALIQHELDHPERGKRKGEDLFF